MVVWGGGEKTTNDISAFLQVPSTSGPDVWRRRGLLVHQRFTGSRNQPAQVQTVMVIMIQLTVQHRHTPHRTDSLDPETSPLRYSHNHHDPTHRSTQAHRTNSLDPGTSQLRYSHGHHNTANLSTQAHRTNSLDPETSHLRCSHGSHGHHDTANRSTQA